LLIVNEVLLSSRLVLWVAAVRGAERVAAGRLVSGTVPSLVPEVSPELATIGALTVDVPRSNVMSSPGTAAEGCRSSGASVADTETLPWYGPLPGALIERLKLVVEVPGAGCEPGLTDGVK